MSKNSEPVENLNRQEIIVVEELIRSYVARDNLEIPGGNTRRQIKVEVRLGFALQKSSA